MRSIKQLRADASKLVAAGATVAQAVQLVMLESMRHAQEHGDVSPAEILLKGIVGKQALNKWAFAHYPLTWKKAEDGTMTLGLKAKREDADWQHDAAAAVMWTEYKREKSTEVRGVKQFRAMLKRVSDGDGWDTEAKKLAEKCLDVVDAAKPVAAKADFPPEMLAKLAAFLQA
jgi:hypothetical protein